MLQRLSVIAAVFSFVSVPSSVQAEVVVEPEPAPAAPVAPPAVAPAAPAVAPAVPQARVHVRSTKSGLVVARITERMFVSGAGGSAAGIAWKDICMAPCQFELEPGLHELMLKGEGHTPLVRQLNLVPGDQYFVAKPGSMSLRFGGYGIATIGLTAALFGGLYLLLPQADEYNTMTNQFEEPEPRRWPLPILLGGLAVTGIGIGMFMAARSDFEPEAGPRLAEGTMVRRAISYRTSF